MKKLKKYSYHTRLSGSIIVSAYNKAEATIKINKAMNQAIAKDIEYKAKIEDVFTYPSL